MKLKKKEKKNTRHQQHSQCSISELNWTERLVLWYHHHSISSSELNPAAQCPLHPSLLLLQLTAEWSINLCHKFTKNAAETRNSHFTIMKIIQTLQPSSLLINIWLLSLFASAAFKLEERNLSEKSLPLCQFQFQSNVNTKKTCQWRSSRQPVENGCKLCWIFEQKYFQSSR